MHTESPFASPDSEGGRHACFDPDGVYLEVTTSATVYNFETGKERHVPAVTLHFKDSGKWQKRSFFGREDENDTLESLLSRLGAWLDQHGLSGAIDQAMGRDGEASAE